VNRYQVYVTPEALSEIKDLPGHIRQRVQRAIQELANRPHPAQSKQLDFHAPERQLCRFRMDKWRIVYAISEAENAIDILAVRKRPPYDYGDLQQLLGELE
jgi:mRNA interferase RelE/StbE